jgi:peptide/nickel transport system substrate-binding protein
MWRARTKIFVSLAVIFLLLSLFVQLLSYFAFLLSGSDKADLGELEKISAPERHATKPLALNQVAEWPREKGRVFTQAPYWDKAVEEGTLLPVAERLPSDPLVIVPADQNGPYGGTWTRFATGPIDVGRFEVRLAYEGLVRWGPMGREIRPNLAKGWKIGDEGRTYTFYLRRGVRWSDGHPFTAEDILFWYEDVLQNRDLTPLLSNQLQRGGELMQLEKLDDYTIRIRFKEPYGLFIKRVATNYGPTMVKYPAHYLKQFHPRYVSEEQLKRLVKEEIGDLWHQVFEDKSDYRNVEMPRLWAWVMSRPPPARPALFTRNPYYWKVDPEGRQLPYIDHVSFEIQNLETINLKAIHGEVGMQGRHIAFHNYSLFMTNQRRGGYRVLHWIDGGDSTIAIAFNLNHKDPVLKAIFHDRRFRIAMSYAINREAVNQVIFKGIGEPSQLSPPLVSAYYVPEYSHAYTDFDPDRANRLLDEMGLTERNGEGIRLRTDGQPLFLQIETGSDVGVSTNLAEMIASDWGAVGIEARVKTTAKQLFSQRQQALLCDVMSRPGSGEIAPLLDPRWFLPYNNNTLYGVDYARWVNSNGTRGERPTRDMLRCVALFRQIEREVEEDEQIRLFKEIIEINRQNLWVIGTVVGIPKLFIVQNNFRNVPEVAVGSWPLRSPGSTAPESYAIDEKERMDSNLLTSAAQ